MRRILIKLFFAAVAVPTIAAAFYAKATDDTQMQTTVAIGLLLLLPIAAFLGLLHPGDKPDEQSDAAAAAPNPCKDAGLARLSRTDTEHPADRIDAAHVKTQAFRRSAGITLVRSPRAKTDILTEGTSWLGGAPALGNMPWPRTEAGTPLHHLAQIDLSSLPQDALPAQMPRTGALAFFVPTTRDPMLPAKVVYVTQTDPKPTPLPDDLPLLYEGENWGYYIKGHTPQTAPRTFPRWPITAMAPPASDPDDSAVANAYMTMKFPDQGTRHISAQKYAKSVPGFGRAFFWDTAQRFANSLFVALDSYNRTLDKARNRVANFGDCYQNDLDTLIAQHDYFAGTVDEVTGWALEHAPWDRMQSTDIAQLQHYFGLIKPLHGQAAPLQPFYKGSPGELRSVGDAANTTLIAAATGDWRTYHNLPAAVRDDIDTHWRLPENGCRHQMFGRGTAVQTAVEEHAHDHLLLQLQSDDLHHWMWGDDGVIQFWISDAALAARDWDQVEVTIEGH